MGLVMLGLQVALSLILAIAGIAKFADLAGSRKAVGAFGIPERFAPVIGTLLPITELLLAVAILPRSTAQWAALAAGVLFLAFTVTIGVNLLHGKKPDCHCFGQLHSSPAGWPTVIRNVALALGAGLVAWQGGQSLPARLSDVTARDWALLLIGAAVLGVVLAQAWLMVKLWQQNGRLLVRVETLEQASSNAVDAAPGSLASGTLVRRAAPAFDLPNIHGGRTSLTSLKQPGNPVLLIFSDPNCGPCNQLLPEIGAWHREHEHLQIAVISRGDPEANRTKIAEYGIPTVVIQKDREVAQAFGVSGTPSAVLILPDGTIRESVATGADAIRALVGRVAEKKPPVIPLRRIDNANGTRPTPVRHAAKQPGIGDLAPAVALPALDGSTVSLDDFRGRDTVMLFWNPGCGFCRRMLPELKRWEQAGADVPALLVVSIGSVEANNEMNLRSTVVIDEGFSTGRAFGASGTPSAVLVDEEGRIASSVAVGAGLVLELLSASEIAGVSARSGD